MLSTLIAILVVALVVFVAFAIVDRIPVPNPFNWIIKAVVGILALVALLQHLGYAV